MSEHVIISLIAASASVINGAMILYMKFRLSRYHKEVNGRLGELIDTNKKLGNAEGTATEKAKHPTKK